MSERPARTYILGRKDRGEEAKHQAVTVFRRGCCRWSGTGEVVKKVNP